MEKRKIFVLFVGVTNEKMGLVFSNIKDSPLFIIGDDQHFLTQAILAEKANYDSEIIEQALDDIRLLPLPYKANSKGIIFTHLHAKILIESTIVPIMKMYNAEHIGLVVLNTNVMEEEKFLDVRYNAGRVWLIGRNNESELSLHIISSQNKLIECLDSKLFVKNERMRTKILLKSKSFFTENSDDVQVDISGSSAKLIYSMLLINDVAEAEENAYNNYLKNVAQAQNARNN